MIRYLKIFVAVCMVLSYLALCVLAQLGLGRSDVSDFVRHVVLVPGLVPLVCWLGFFFISSPRSASLFWLAVVVTLFHVFVFAVSAHFDCPRYWGVQLAEIVSLWFLARQVCRRNGEG